VEYLGERFESNSGDEDATVYDSRIGNESDYNYTVNTSDVVPDEISLPVDDEDIQACIDDSISGPDIDDDDTVTAGDYSDDDDLEDNLFDTSGGDIRYYNNDSLDIEENVTFDTTGGAVELHIEDDFELGGNVTVRGDSPVFVLSRRRQNWTTVHWI